MHLLLTFSFYICCVAEEMIGSTQVTREILFQLFLFFKFSILGLGSVTLVLNHC